MIVRPGSRHKKVYPTIHTHELAVIHRNGQVLEPYYVSVSEVGLVPYSGGVVHGGVPRMNCPPIVLFHYEPLITPMSHQHKQFVPN